MGEHSHHDQPPPGDESPLETYTQAYDALKTMTTKPPGEIKLPRAMDALKIICIEEGIGEQHTTTNADGEKGTFSDYRLLVPPADTDVGYTVQVMTGATSVGIWKQTDGKVQTMYQFFRADSPIGGETVDVMELQKDANLALMEQGYDHLDAHEAMHQAITAVLGHIRPPQNLGPFEGALS